MKNQELSQSLSTEETATYLGVSINTLASWRCRGQNDIPYLKIGRRVRYRISDLDEFVSKNLRIKTK